MRTRARALVTAAGAIGLLVVALALHALAPPALAQPGISESDPAPGDALGEPPEVIHLCFTEPVSIENQDFDFAIRTPEGMRPGSRTRFQRSGDCANVFIGRTLGEVEGTWSLTWEVTSQTTGELGSGSFEFTVGVEPVPTAGASPTPDGATGDGGDDGPDILAMALITTGVAAGAAALGLVLYLVRRRIGFWLHAPPAEDDGEAGAPH